ncbi:MAG: RNA-binding S4 domain-containing protein [Solobacterium sp.]|nr:RNA-binding S4 domain-containing protein [Solobacterium sp.]MBR3203473.1 RNA-binding S4 domain-containing protein [Solobacterium sp.]MBR3346537.1 RNA-binding S4 domain-containing protein [Solobacterium sp.]
MRIDKWLKVSRILKRRTISQELAKNERVEINGKAVKPSHEVKIGDEVSVRFGSRKLTVRVCSIEDVKRKQEAAELYEVIREEIVPTEQSSAEMDEIRV